IKIPVLFILFFFLTIATRMKCMNITSSCFVKRGKYRHECNDFGKPVGFCRKVNTKCCM
uniref:Defensin beta 133 n=1 Tax=Suricata suricatta TaxID=37032 RepID=A0A673TR67_SURSU